MTYKAISFTCHVIIWGLGLDVLKIMQKLSKINIKNLEAMFTMARQMGLCVKLSIRCESAFYGVCNVAPQKTSLLA